MKVLKSGVEMTPAELRKVKGGDSCACGCEGGYDSETLWTSARDGLGCFCGCTTSKDARIQSIMGAQFYPV